MWDGECSTLTQSASFTSWAPATSWGPGSETLSLAELVKVFLPAGVQLLREKLLGTVIPSHPQVPGRVYLHI